MLIDLARKAGNALVIERMEATVDFEGGAVEEGVLATFQAEGREMTGRVIRAYDSAAGAEQVVEVELIDETGHDIESELTLSRLPPGDDTGTKI